MADFDLSMVITAEGDAAAAEVGKVEKSIERMSAAEFRAAGGMKGLEAASTKAASALSNEGGAATKGAAALDRLAGSSDRAAQAAVRMGRGMGQDRASQAQLGYQIQDISMGLSTGTSAFTILAQQAGQTAMAVQGMGGKFANVARIVGGPFGSIMIAAIAVLGNLWLSSKKAETAQKELGEGMDFASMSAKELIKSLDELEAAQLKSIQTSYESERAKYADATAALAAARAKREEARAILESLVANRSLSAGAGGDAGMIAGEIGGARSQLAAIDASILSAEGLERAAAVPIIRRNIAAATDLAAAATLRYDKAEKDLRKSYLATGDLDKYRDGLTKITKAREADLDAARKANREPRKGGGLPEVTRGEVARLIGTTINPGGGLRSAAANRNAGGAANSYHLSGNAIDIPLTVNGRPLTKESIRAALAPAGIAIKELLGPGDKNHSDHFHIAFAKARKGADELAKATDIAADKARRAAETLANFGERARDSIGSIADRFSETPSAIIATNAALADLDKIIKDLGEKKPIGFEALIGDARAAKEAVEQGLTRPYRDFLESQERALDIAQLISQGRHDEAAALQQIFTLEASMGPLSLARKDAILASVQALRGEQLEAEKLQLIIGRQVTAIHQLRDGVRGLFSSGGGGLAALPGKIMGAVEQYVGDFIFDKLFGDFFRDLEDQAKGTEIVKDASERFRAAIIETANPSLDRLAEAASKASAALGAVSASGSDSGSGGAPGGVFEEGGEIVVTGTRRKAKGIPSDPAGFFGHIVTELAKGVLGKEMAATLGRIIGDALKGAALGNMGAGLIGQKPGVGSAIGGALGGALGKAVGPAIGKAVGGTLGKTLGGLAGPLGSVLGGMAGSLLGGLLGGGPKLIKGSSTITSAHGASAFSGSESVRAQSNALATSVQAGLQDIASQLGGGLGSFAVSIGTRHGDYRVDTSGKGITKKKKGAIDFDDDQGAAIAYAIADAIKDGAITGLSAAVHAALNSSEDIQRALREAIKVQNLETLLGGIGASFDATFRAIENQAKENLRLAQTYGLDMAKTEELNARARSEAFESVIRERTGALKDFLADLDFGDLFEGTLVDQRKAIQTQIEKAQSEVVSGQDGAAQRLADLQRRLLEVSREAYGTAGPEYGGDLAAARQAAEAAIAIETQRARESQERAIASLNAETQQVTLQNETNSLLARSNGILERIAAGGGFVGGLAGAISNQVTERSVALY